MSTLFISYSSKDREHVADLERRLRAEGYESLFWDKHPDDGIPAGSDWQQQLGRHLKTCHALVVLYSANWEQSKWCFAEAVYAGVMAKTVFPLIIASCPLSPLLSRFEAIDLLREGEAGYNRLWQGLKRLDLSPHSLYRLDSSRPPYPGLASFEEEDAAVFCGRAKETVELADQLMQMRQRGQKPLLLVVGPSGSGKSSLVRAGVVPALKRIQGCWLVQPVFRWNALLRGQFWGDRLLRDLFALSTTSARTGIEPPDRKVVEMSDAPKDDSEPNMQMFAETFLRHSKDLIGGRDVTPLLILDQLEELLLAHGDEPANRDAKSFLIFLSCLLSSADSPWLCLATLRSDFLHLFQTNAELQALTHELYSLPLMQRSNFYEVIRGPAERIGVTFESDALVDRMVQDTATPDALPLLAFTLRELYDRFGGDLRLTVDEYVKGLGGLEGCLQGAAEDLVPTAAASISDHSPGALRTRLDPAVERGLRDSFVEHLVQVHELDGEVKHVKRPAKWDDLPEVARPLLEQFIDKRLLCARGEGTERIIEVAHDALFRVWPTLKDWVQDRTDDLRERGRIESAAAQWNRDGRRSDDLWHGARLTAARQRWGHRETLLSPGARDFLRASQSRARQSRLLKTGFTIASLAAVLILLVGWIDSQLAKSRSDSARAATILSQGRDAREAVKHASAAVAVLQIGPPRLLPWVDRERQRAVLSLRHALMASRSRMLPFSLESAVLCASISPHTNQFPAGDQIAAGDQAGILHLIDVASRTQRTLLELEAPVRGCSFNTAGDWVLCHGASIAGLASIKTKATNRLDHGAHIHRAMFVPGQDLLVTAGAEESGGGRVIHWQFGADALDIVPIRTNDFFDEVIDIRFATNRSDFLVLTSNHLYRQDGAERLQLRAAEQGHVFVLADWSSDAKRIVVVQRRPMEGGTYPPHILAVYDASNLEQISTQTYADRILSVCFDPSGTLILAGCGERVVRVWNFLNLFDGHTSRLHGHSQEVSSAEYNRLGDHIVSASADGTVRLWEAPEGRFENLHASRAIGHACEARSPGDRYRLVGSRDRKALLFERGEHGWDASSTEPTFVLRHPDAVTAVAFHPSIVESDGVLLATACSDLMIRLWTKLGNDWEEFAVLPGHTQVVTELEFAPDGHSLVTRSKAGQRTYSCEECGPLDHLRQLAKTR